MIYLKSILTGLSALILALLLVSAVLIGTSIMRSPTPGIGAVAGGVPLWPVLSVSILAFAAGFYWRYRKLA